MTGLLDPHLRVPPVPVDTADVCSMHDALPDTARTVADDLDDVRRSAQQLLSGVDRQPTALRIRAGDVLVELEWADENAVVPIEAAPVAAVAAVRTETSTTVAVATAPAPPASDGFADICANTVGTFYRAAEPGTAPFVTEGDHVRRGQQVAIIEVMKLMIPVEAERDGQIVAVHVADGTSVEYGDRLLTLAPATGR
ncbi:acetyl-CoA carboxylase biotin carboxyl carrier protein [Catellatospora methionotrophica]|uniref:acetyl-CoA carboxylase biotin carboxyl carrier protein n=1 Tax=Catellatospora methionotrophica TaxID=121620 RepID=UPI0033EC7A50